MQNFYVREGIITLFANINIRNALLYKKHIPLQ